MTILRLLLIGLIVSTKAFLPGDDKTYRGSKHKKLALIVNTIAGSIVATIDF